MVGLVDYESFDIRRCKLVQPLGTEQGLESCHRAENELSKAVAIKQIRVHIQIRQTRGMMLALFNLYAPLWKQFPGLVCRLLGKLDAVDNHQ